MRFRLIFSIVGFITVVCGLSMILPAGVDFFYKQYDSASRFSIISAVTVCIGSIILLITDQVKTPLRTKEMFLTTTIVWFVYSFFCALPIYFSGYQLSFGDSFFESVSGLTTTGATVLTNLDHMSPGLLFWRSLTQYMGGIGIIMVAILILPTLHIGGMQFFATESSAKSERDTTTVAKSMWPIIIYFVGMTVLCAFCLWCAGMGIFDSVNHAMSTLSTAGFSTHDASIAYFKNPLIEWILTLFMVIGGLPLILGLYLFKRQWRLVKNNEQIKLYLTVLFIAVFIMSSVRLYETSFQGSIHDVIRSTAFSVVSVVTSTGFVTENFEEWGTFSVVFFLFLMSLGACTGSTSGGIKMFRFSILGKTITAKLKSHVQPHGVFVPRYGDKPVTDEIVVSVLVYLGLFFITLVLTTLGLSLYDLDLVTSLSGAITAISNVGPALGDIIGPDQSFAALPEGAKWILSVAMLLGRLEFIAIIVVCFPFLWKKNA